MPRNGGPSIEIRLIPQISAVDLKKGRTIAVTDLKELIDIDERSSIKSLAVAADDHLLLAGMGDGRVLLGRWNSDEEIAVLGNHAETVTAVSFTSESKYAISASYDEMIKVWDLGREQPTRQLTKLDDIWIRDLAFIPGQNRIVTVSQKGALSLWDARNGNQLDSFAVDDGPCSVVRAIGDGSWLLCVQENEGGVSIWNTEPLRYLGGIDTYWGDILDATFADDEKQYMIAFPGGIEVWDTEARQLEHRSISASDIVQAALTEDGQYGVLSTKTGPVTVWNVRSRSTLARLAIDASISALALTPSLDKVAVALGSGQLIIWDIETDRAQQISAQQFHTLALSEDGRLAAGLDNKNLYLYDLETRSLITTFSSDSAITACAIDIETLTIAAATALGQVHCLSLEGWRR